MKTSNLAKLLVPQSSILKFVLVAKLVQQFRCTVSSRCSNSVPQLLHPATAAHRAHRTLCALDRNCLCHSVPNTCCFLLKIYKKRNHFFLPSVIRRTTTGAFSDPAVQSPLMYQPAGCHNKNFSCSPEALQWKSQLIPISGRCLS